MAACNTQSLATPIKATITLEKLTNTPTTIAKFLTKTPILCPPSSIESQLQNLTARQNYIGLIFRDLPERLHIQIERSALILESPADYGFQEVIRQDNTHMLWFEKVACRDGDGKTYWKLLDVTEMPAMSEDEELVFWYCQLDGQEDMDPELVAIGYGVGHQYITKVNFLWRLNRQTNQIESLLPEGVQCRRDIGEGHP